MGRYGDREREIYAEARIAREDRQQDREREREKERERERCREILRILNQPVSQ